jgi:hypothetical protein
MPSTWAIAADTAATHNTVSRQSKNVFVKLTNYAGYDNTRGMSIERDSQTPDPVGSGFCNSGGSITKSAENSRKTVEIVAVLPIAEPSAAQDFRDECDAVR